MNGLVARKADAANETSDEVGSCANSRNIQRFMRLAVTIEAGKPAEKSVRRQTFALAHRDNANRP